MTVHRLRFTVAVMAVLVLLATACSTQTEPGSSSAGASASGGDQGSAEATGLTPLTIAVTPILPTFSVYVAQQEGFFEQHGLDVQLQEIFGSPLIGQAVQSGEAQIGTRNYDGVVSAIASGGVDLEVLYPVVVYDQEQPDAFVMMRSDLAEQGLQALEGETFAVTLGSQQAEAAKQYLADEGVDVDAIEFVEVGYSDMAAAFESGSLGGAHVVEPFITQLEREGLAQSMGAHLGYVGERYLINAAFARGDWIEQNPDVVDSFVAAMEQATEHIMSDHAAMLPLASEYTDTPEDVLTEFYPSRYVLDTELTEEEVRSPITFSAEAGFHEQVPLDDVLAEDFPLEE